MSGSPEELLRSALEKIVFFECRVANLESETEALRATCARGREEVGAARRRETELETALAKARGEGSVARSNHTEVADRVRLLEAERERFLSGMVERARVAGAPADERAEPGDESDLAGFIAELRAEIVNLQAWKRAAEAAGVRPEGPAAAPPQPPVPRAPLPAMADHFEAAGRFGVSQEQARALKPAFSTRSERALYEASLDDLASRDPAARRRAADCLRALGSRTAAPLLAASLGREGDAEVKMALLAALAQLAEPSAAPLAVRELEDERAPVRAAALEAVSALARDAALPQLAAALADPSSLVRRRAVVLLGFTKGDGADDALASALGDRDAGVARAAAAALSGRPSARAQGALARALDHRAPEVRQAAARAVGRWSGEAIDLAASEPDRRRTARRMSEKLLGVGGAALREAVTHVAFSKATPHARATANGRAAGSGAPPPPPAPPVDGALADAAVLEVRAALRGRTAAELAATLSRPPPDVEATLHALVSQGRLVARGPRFFST